MTRGDWQRDPYAVAATAAVTLGTIVYFSCRKTRTRNCSEYSLWGKKVSLNIPAQVFPTDAEFKAMEDTMPGCQHGWFQSTTGAQLHFRKFVPPDNRKPQGVVVFQHGIQTHSGKAYILDNGRKLNMALMSDRLVKAGYYLYALDMLGHGYSEGDRWFIPYWKVNRDDLDNFGRFVALQHEGLPIMLQGESYGGTLTVHVAKEWQTSQNPPQNFAGIILTGPAIVPADMPPWPVYALLRYGLAPVFPKWTPFFMPNPVSPDRIWADKNVLKLHMAPRDVEMQIDGSGRPFRLGTAVGLLLALQDSRSLSIPGLTVPFCSIHGVKDAAVPVAGTDFLADQAATPKEDCSVYRLEESYHDLLGDPAAEQVMDLMIAFMDDRVAKAMGNT